MILLDQTKLPLTTEFVEIVTIEEMWDAIQRLVVRGAPAIGIAAAYGLYLGVKDSQAQNYEDFIQEVRKQAKFLSQARPTAVNLNWALARMEAQAEKNKNKTLATIKASLLEEAHRIRDEDEAMCRKIGEHGLTLLRDGMTILTHCNAGSYATARYGTALAPIYLAKEKGWEIRVFANETRPLLQGSRLTAHELLLNGIHTTLITDSMAAHVMGKGLVHGVIVGCDRVAANGDVANKIGTYGLAILAKAHGLPFYVAGPSSTLDLSTATGKEIEIEERDPVEITAGMGKPTAPPGVKVFNPAFDVTPYEYITALITEKGIIRPPYQINLQELGTC